MSPMAEDLDANHNDNNHSPAGSAGSVGSGGSTGTGGIPMLVVHKREMVQIMDDHHHSQQEANHHNQHGHMEADDQPIDDQDNTDGDALSPQKRPINNNNNDVATVFLIDTSEVGTGHHDDADHPVDVDEVFKSIPI